MPEWLRYRDLKMYGVLWSREYVRQLQKRHEFPMHEMLGPKTAAWRRTVIEQYVSARLRKASE